MHFMAPSLIIQLVIMMVIDKHSKPSRITSIKACIRAQPKFEFHKITTDNVTRLIKSLNLGKSHVYLCKDNYRSVNLLIFFSKLFERIRMAEQLAIYIESILSPRVSAYRRGYSCQHAIISPTDYWRKALDAWWRHRMETFSAFLAICAGNSPVSGEFPT